MYIFRWTYNTPSIPQYHGKAGEIMFHTLEVAQEFYNRTHSDARYVGLRCMQYWNGSCLDIRGAFEYRRTGR